MKKIYLSVTGITLFMASCTAGFLDLEPQTSLMDNNFYSTIDDAEMALIGCYDGYQRTTSNGNTFFYLMSELMADDCFAGGGNSGDRNYAAVDRFDRSQSPSERNLFNGTWEDYYAAIFRVNTLLQKMDDIDFEDNQTVRNRIMGEVRFLRALLYFDMVRMWERIPLLTEPSTENLPQVEPEQTYQLIVDDLLFAADNILADAYPKAEAIENDGRATPYAAKALLARVYLFYTGYYETGDNTLGLTKEQVLQGLEDIIQSNEYDLVPEFKTLWPAACYVADFQNNTLDKSAYAGEGNCEVVFAQKFNNTSDWNGMYDGNRWIVYLGMQSTNYAPYGSGWGVCQVDGDFFNSFEKGDKRQTASIIDVAGEGIEPIYDKNNQREYTGYTIKKYSPTALPDGTSDTGGSNDYQISQEQDYIIIRYADVLLMAAELGSTNAQAYLDKVRQRAGLPSKPATVENILQERRFELCFEGIRYWDVLRQGINKASQILAKDQVLLSGGAPDHVVISPENVIKTRGLCMIPGKQIDLSNGKLTQNAGWE